MLTSLFWLIGGVFFYKLARMLVPTEAAVLATAYYLFVPSGILLSRSFQPDALMMAMFLASLFIILKYYQQPSGVKLMLAAGITGLTLLHRPLVLPALLAAFSGLAIARQGIWKALFRGQVVVFFVVGLLPTALYYGYGMFVAGFLRPQVEISFLPNLLLHPQFWVGWLDLGVDAVGATALVGAMVGLPMLSRGVPRALAISLASGYVVFCLLFTMHACTHGYYHAQLIPIVAIPLGVAVLFIVNCLRATCETWYWWLPMAGILTLAMLVGFREVRSRLGLQVLESEQVAREIGELVGHSTHVVFLAPYYGMPLQYYGELTGAYWHRSITYWLYRRPDERNLSVEDRLEAFGFRPRYFVITEFNEFRSHHTDLKEYLTENCSVLAETPQYLIYNSCQAGLLSQKQ
jgi:4-amino-4-deoxy-L-arabinose transferase-like glycosyltransferase